MDSNDMSSLVTQIVAVPGGAAAVAYRQGRIRSY
jgi:hypothetical protein